MSNLRNNVQLIGNVGNNPEITNFESGKKVARFSLATNEFYYVEDEKTQQTYWHNLVACGKQADIIKKYVGKGKEIAISGKLTSGSYENKDGVKQFVTEVIIHEVLLLGKKTNEGN